jgi:two-component system osmolarity sensor histidine kinase EnvZ
VTQGATPKPSLARQNARLLALVFSLFLLTVAIAGGSLLMAPMARRSADDLAGLMLLSAQTWSELPPATRADFEVELARAHWLSLRDPGPTPQGPTPGADDWHGFYIYALETALAHKTGNRQHLSQETRDGEAWLWATLPSGEGSIAVGFPARRVGTQPLRTLLITLGAGLLLAIFTATWLARRISGPLARLEKATSAIGRGEIPDPLPETGPRELAALAAHFNRMARQVRELLAVRTTLMAGVSHDLRTPLARMRLALALLAEQPSPRLIARLEQDIGEMDQLIGKVLDLARGLDSEAGEDLDLGDWLAQLAKDYPTGRVRYDPASRTPVAALAAPGPAPRAGKSAGQCPSLRRWPAHRLAAGSYANRRAHRRARPGSLAFRPARSRPCSNPSTAAMPRAAPSMGGPGWASPSCGN